MAGPTGGLVVRTLGLAGALLLIASAAGAGRRSPGADRARSLRVPPASNGRPRGAGAARSSVELLRRSPVGAVLSGLRKRRRAARLRTARERALPAAVDLLAVAVAAGCPPYEAITAVAPWMPAALGPSFEGVVARCAAGDGLSDAVEAVLGTDPVLRPVARALDVNDRLGAPVGPALGRLAATVRAEVRRRDEARARTVPVRLLFPLVFLVLPAFGLLTVVPALLVSFRSL